MHNIILIMLLIIKVHPLGFLIDDQAEKLYADYFLKPEPTVKTAEVKLISTPVKNSDKVIDFPSRAHYAIDLGTNQILLEKNQNESLPVASLTKLMTAYLTLKNLPLDQKIKVTTNFQQIGDATANLQNGEEISVLNALQATLINSASETAVSLAIAHSGSTEAFVEQMNQAAAELGLTNTHFANPVGWDDSNNYSSAKDIASLTRILLRNETFKDIVTKKHLQFSTTNGRVISLENTNQLLGNNGFSGVKTGFTYIAGECLVSLNKTENKEVLTVVIGSNNRFGETIQIINWIYTHYLW